MRSKIKYNCMFILCLFVYLLRWGYQAVFQLLLQCSFACLCAGLCPSALFPPVPFCPSAPHWVPRVVHATSYPQKTLAVLSHIVCNCITRIQVKTELLYPVSYLYPFFPNYMSYLLNLLVTCIVKTSI